MTAQIDDNSIKVQHEPAINFNIEKMISTVPKWLGDLAEGNILKSMQILDIQQLSATIKKIRFHGNISTMSFSPGNGNAIRVSNNDLRNYTISEFNKSTNEFEIIFYLNDVGIGSRFIDSLSIGSTIYMDKPRGKTCYNEQVKKHFFIGDETSLGLACSLIPVFRKNNHDYKFFLELDKSNASVPEKLNLDNVTVVQKGQFAKERMIDVLSLSNQDLENGQFILTGNASSVQTIRKELKMTNGNAKIYAKGYWLKGKKGL